MGLLDETILMMERRRLQLRWQRLPSRIILLRHGQSEGNVNPGIYSFKGDSRLELTPKGLEESQQAGARLAKLEGLGKIFVAVSPFERCQQTLYGLFEGGFPRDQVGVLHHDPRIREQEFGNFQSPGLTAAVRVEEQAVGRFYYRRPNAESCADVFDRVNSFWESLVGEGPSSMLLERDSVYDTCLLVTHGLTVRLLLAAVFKWSVSTFESVFNMGNCEHIVLGKNEEKCCYEILPQESHPAHMPWATRPVWIRLRNKTPKEDTLRKLEQLRALINSQRAHAAAAAAAAASTAASSSSSAPTTTSTTTITITSTTTTTASTSAGGSAGGHSRSSHSSHAGTSSSSSSHHAAGSSHSWPELEAALDSLEGRALAECCEPFTVVDYLSIKPPRTMAIDDIAKQLVRGHDVRGSREQLLELAHTRPPIARADIVDLDWWGDTLSYRGRALHMRMDKRDLVAPFLDVSTHGRTGDSLPDVAMSLLTSTRSSSSSSSSALLSPRSRMSRDITDEMMSSYASVGESFIQHPIQGSQFRGMWNM
eukprot:gnl/Spiro4/15685_TR8432_c1_g1_i1.p1 gnl/Spiro4/15685_TR8432_c1_g1~~gnl/Spiro4/15685_TR8432_c1_g1_i1.p1  ORF type:complete len:628 (-),score=201.29 gnl/Spiro4/15685_TR8432_c1_g1_i1:41-1651(-)